MRLPLAASLLVILLGGCANGAPTAVPLEGPDPTPSPFPTEVPIPAASLAPTEAAIRQSDDDLQALLRGAQLPIFLCS
jgi:hypothetical protein